jgi:hypothetical protein
MTAVRPESRPEVEDPAPRSRFGELVVPERTLKRLIVSVRVGHDSLWVCASQGRGGFAIRAAFCPAGELAVVSASEDENWTIDLATSVGAVRCEISVEDGERPLLHVSSRLVPARPVQLDGWPRDLVAFGPSRDPLLTTGVVHT